MILKYRRMSGIDITVSSPRAATAAAMVTAVMYPSVRIVGLLSFGARSAPPQHHDDEHDDHDYDDGSDADKHGRVSYFLKTSLSFSPACLRRPMA